MITSASNKRIKDIQKLKENKNIKKYGKYLNYYISLFKKIFTF